MEQNMKKKKYFPQRGQSLVEFSLTLIIIMTLLAGAVDLGSAFFIFIELRDAAQEGAFYGSTAAVVDNNGIVVSNRPYNSATDVLNAAAIEARVRQSSTSPANLADVTTTTVTISTTTPPCAGGGITVAVRYNYTLSMPLIGAVLGTQTIPISASMTDTILKPSCP
jgi:Flp pilus assembly protein TadG